MRNQFTVTRMFRFCAAHRLMLHGGRCRNLHGHNYAVNAIITGYKGTSTNMVIDFGKLKEVLSPAVDEFDHKLILNEEDHLLTIQKFVDAVGRQNIIEWGGDPTAESMAEYFAGKFKALLEISLPGNEFHVEVEVEETPGNTAIY